MAPLAIRIANTPAPSYACAPARTRPTGLRTGQIRKAGLGPLTRRSSSGLQVPVENHGGEFLDHLNARLLRALQTERGSMRHGGPLRAVCFQPGPLQDLLAHLGFGRVANSHQKIMTVLAGVTHSPVRDQPAGHFRNRCLVRFAPEANSQLDDITCELLCAVSGTRYELVR